MTHQNTLSDKRLIYLGRGSLGLQISGLLFLLFYALTYDNPNDWFSLGIIVVGGGTFAALTFIGTILGSIVLLKKKTICSQISTIAGTITLVAIISLFLIGGTI